MAGTVSDDLAVTRAMNDAGLPIVFVPQAVVASVEDCSLSELLEFTTRQIKITRVYGTRYWVMAFVGSGVFNIVVAGAMLIIVLSRTNDLAVWISIITLACCYLQRGKVVAAAAGGETCARRARKGVSTREMDAQYAMGPRAGVVFL